MWLSAILVALWTALVLVAVVTTSVAGFRAWRQGRHWAEQLAKSQVRLRMNGGLTLKGGSAGLPFCLNTLLALYRTDARAARGSWLWRRMFQKLHGSTRAWAASGVITPDGFLKPVVLEAKLRACLKHHDIKHLLTPRQPEATNRALKRISSTPAPRTTATTPAVAEGVRLGFAAEEQSLTIHPCRHLAQALMRVGELISRRQTAMNFIAVAVSVVMLMAAHDLRGILRPPTAPIATAPGSPSPRYLWVSLDTKHPEYFLVVLESISG